MAARVHYKRKYNDKLPLCMLTTAFPFTHLAQVSALLTALGALLLKDKDWVSAALSHLRRVSLGESAGGRLTDTAAKLGVEQQRRLLSFDFGKSVGLELAPSIQQLAELFLCSQGEEVREKCWIRFL